MELTFLFLSLAAIYHNNVLAMLVATDATILAPHTLLHNALHLSSTSEVSSLA